MRGVRHGFRVPHLMRLHDYHESCYRQYTHQSPSGPLPRGVHGTKNGCHHLLFVYATAQNQMYSKLAQPVLALGASLDLQIAKEWD